MLATRESVVPLAGASNASARIIIRTLPGKDHISGTPSLVELTEEEQLTNDGEARVQLLEDGEYAYEFDEVGHADSGTTWQTDHPEIFSPDSPTGHRGRVRPRSYTGTLATRVVADGIGVGEFRLEVRSRKLDYRRHYRWMMTDVARMAVGLVGESFAASQQSLTTDLGTDSSSAYQRFALLRHLIENPVIAAATARVTADPHEDWVEETQWRDVRRGLAAGGLTVRQLVSGTPRVGWPGSYIPGLSSLPAQLPSRRTETTVDTVPNRFVKFALNDWFETVQTLGSHIAAQAASASRIRGLLEVAQVEATLVAGLAAPIFSEVGDLSFFPSGNQVLARREGYREIFQAYAQSQLALGLSWSGGETVFGAGQRNVARLYEYWCYLVVADVMRELCEHWNGRSIVDVSDSQVNIDLCGGKQSVVSGKAHRLGRVIDVELYFNRTFSQHHQSWSVQMRPDCSISLTGDDEVNETWVHLDAKYRIDSVGEIFGDNAVGSDDEDGTAPTVVGAKRDDLLKMHAYRDAIRRSAGAYVLYPGHEQVAQPLYRQYHEILPGLGAFPLRPADDGSPIGRRQLAVMPTDVVDKGRSPRAEFGLLKSTQRRRLPCLILGLLSPPMEG